ncbi:MAG: hypothetical protein HYW48_10870, partial [Deltaproteobacteria bacterium]|nr:hypothetical protein [Deltaproteobacteria bacterium]
MEETAQLVPPRNPLGGATVPCYVNIPQAKKRPPSIFFFKEIRSATTTCYSGSKSSFASS